MTRTILAAAILALAVTAQAQGDLKGDPERAKTKISMCAGCHGIPDYRTAYPEVYYVPMIAGQNPSMRAIAATLSGQDMADLAVYYATVAK